MQLEFKLASRMDGTDWSKLTYKSAYTTGTLCKSDGTFTYSHSVKSSLATGFDVVELSYYQFDTKNRSSAKIYAPKHYFATTFVELNSSTPLTDIDLAPSTSGSLRTLRGTCRHPGAKIRLYWAGKTRSLNVTSLKKLQEVDCDANQTYNITHDFDPSTYLADTYKTGAVIGSAHLGYLTLEILDQVGNQQIRDDAFVRYIEAPQLTIKTDSLNRTGPACITAGRSLEGTCSDPGQAISLQVGTRSKTTTSCQQNGTWKATVLDIASLETSTAVVAELVRPSGISARTQKNISVSSEEISNLTIDGSWSSLLSSYNSLTCSQLQALKPTALSGTCTSDAGSIQLELAGETPITVSCTACRWSYTPPKSLYQYQTSPGSVEIKLNETRASGASSALNPKFAFYPSTQLITNAQTLSVYLRGAPFGVGWANRQSLHGTLCNDIDLSGQKISGSPATLSGRLDGSGFSILRFSGYTSGNSGLVNDVDYSGAITNLTVKTSNYQISQPGLSSAGSTATKSVGILSNENRGLIENVNVQGDLGYTFVINGDFANRSMGGVTGLNTGTIKGSFAQINLDATVPQVSPAPMLYVGGIAGSNTGTIRHSLSAGLLRFAAKEGVAGGIAGQSGATCSTIGTNCNESGVLVGNHSTLTLQSYGSTYLTTVGGVVGKVNGPSQSDLYLSNGQFAPSVVAHNVFGGRVILSSIPEARSIIGGIIGGGPGGKGGQVRFNLMVGSITPGFTARFREQTNTYGQTNYDNLSDAWGAIYGNWAGVSSVNGTIVPIHPWAQVSNNVQVTDGFAGPKGGLYTSGCEVTMGHFSPYWFCTLLADTGSSAVSLNAFQASTLPRASAFTGFDGDFWDLEKPGFPTLKGVPYP